MCHHAQTYLAKSRVPFALENVARSDVDCKGSSAVSAAGNSVLGFSILGCRRLEKIFFRRGVNQSQPLVVVFCVDVFDSNVSTGNVLSGNDFRLIVPGTAERRCVHQRTQKIGLAAPYKHVVEAELEIWVDTCLERLRR